MNRYRMPAEWEPQAAVWAAWPDNQETWPENSAAAKLEFTALVKTLAEMVPVYVMVNQPSLESAQHHLGNPDAHHIGLVDIPTNDAWARDHAPTFVIQQSPPESSLVAVDWDYNAWGGKYPPFDSDQLVARRIAEGLGIESLRPGLCFEGGAVETNGQGVILSTLSCATDPNRNPGRSAEQLVEAFEDVFRNWLGATHIWWLPGDAIEGDDTDGHIDQLVRFTDASTLVYAWCDPDDPQFPGLAANLKHLQQASADHPDDFNLIPLPIPPAMEHCGRRIPASYCNFLITNGLVVVPQFGCPADQIAIDILRPLFPDRHVFGLPSRNLSVGLGSFHCLTQQQPSVGTGPAKADNR